MWLRMWLLRRTNSQVLSFSFWFFSFFSLFRFILLFSLFKSQIMKHIRVVTYRPTERPSPLLPLKTFFFLIFFPLFPNFLFFFFYPFFFKYWGRKCSAIASNSEDNSTYFALQKNSIGCWGSVDFFFYFLCLSFGKMLRLTSLTIRRSYDDLLQTISRSRNT